MDRKETRNKLLELIQDNDAKIKNHLNKIYDGKIPSKALRNAREFGVYINGEKFNLRSGIDSKYTFNGIDVKLSRVTNYMETLDSNKVRPEVKVKLPTWTALERKASSDSILFKTQNALRKFKSTGVLDGKLIDNLINRQGDANKAIDELKFLRENGDINVKQFDAGMESIFKKVNRYSGRKNVVGGKLTYNPNNWKNYGTPIGADGVLKTPENFIKKVNKYWEDQGILNRIIKTATGWEIHRGHGVASESFGPNIFNVAPQPALATTAGGEIGAGGLSANIQQGAKTIKSKASLQSANIATTVSEAYQHYLLDDHKGINKLSDLLLSDQAKLLHKKGLDTDAADIIGRQRLIDEGGKAQLGIDSVFKGKTNRMLKLIKQGSGKVKDITFGKTPHGFAARGMGLYQWLDFFDPSHGTELEGADLVQGRVPRTKENISSFTGSWLNDIKDTTWSAAKTIPYIKAGSSLASVYAPAATSTFMGTAGLATIPISALLLFDSYDNIFHDGKIKEWFVENDPGRAAYEGSKHTAIPGDVDYRGNRNPYGFNEI